MNFQQTKLSKTEWENCEIPVSQEEKKILLLIQDGYRNINVKYNDNQSLISIIKIEKSPEIETFLYIKYFLPILTQIIPTKTKDSINTQITTKANEFINRNLSKTKQPKKIDQMRLMQLDSTIEKQRPYIFEFTLLDYCKELLETIASSSSKSTKRKTNCHHYTYYIYNLIQLKQAFITNCNKHVLEFVNIIVQQFIETYSLQSIIIDIFHHSQEYIEKNTAILKYENKTLYQHQKSLFQLFSKTNDCVSSTSKLVFYTAPTGTGKTLSPLGLSVEYKIIYICASRHIGLAFAKNAISIEKKVAFAFGCETANDIRLHYFAAKDYEKNRKTGGICKVDNSNGEKVEIMICDVASYLVAMYYMLSFNNEKQILMYWDEPTISLDFPPPSNETEIIDEHPLHKIINELWKNNTISNIILSCATLPHENELIDVIMDYRGKFDNVEIHTINSYDCKKTISLINKHKYTIVPHLFFENYDEINMCIQNCHANKTLLRYFDLNEIIKFVEYVCSVPELEVNPLLHVCNYFHTIDAITMNNIKVYYLEVLSVFSNEKWKFIYPILKNNQKTYWDSSRNNNNNNNNEFKKIKSMEQQPTPVSSKPFARLLSLQEPIVQTNESVKEPTNNNNIHDGVLLTTKDAHTLTDGVTIFFAEDVEKIGRFMIHQSNIPTNILDTIAEKIRTNQTKKTRLEHWMKTLDDKMGKEQLKEKKMEKENFSPEVKKIIESIELLKTEIQNISLDSHYIPNTKQHQNIWCNQYIFNAFVSSIDESTIQEVMDLQVTIQMKLLLLMGIGVFSKETMDIEHNKYMEIIKKMCFQQKLYLIIANSDFIYGINYQMCHAFFGKDLINMSQQKIIQAIGRIGRGNIQQEYTVRIRDDEIFKKLLLPQTYNIEAINMCRLFNSMTTI